MRLALGICILAVVGAVGAPTSQASPITFSLTYSGNQFENRATGTGTITFDDEVLPNPGALANVTAETLGVLAFSITIANASSGNGTFGLSSVTNWIWNVSQEIDLGTELVGQTGFNDFNWCTFNFDGCTPPAPGGVSPFVIRTNAETGDSLILISMKRVATAVPEPATLTLVGLGLLGIAGMRRRAGQR